MHMIVYQVISAGADRALCDAGVFALAHQRLKGPLAGAQDQPEEDQL
jgi:hypothetical protein